MPPYRVFGEKEAVKGGGWLNAFQFSSWTIESRKDRSILLHDGHVQRDIFQHGK